MRSPFVEMELDGREPLLVLDGAPTAPDGPPGEGRAAEGQRQEQEGGGGGGGAPGDSLDGDPAAAAGPLPPEEEEELPPGLGPPGWRGQEEAQLLVPSCPGLPAGAPPGEEAAPALGAPSPQGPPRELLPRGKCLLDNWQEERATNPLDRVPPDPEGVTEGYFFRHGHRGLLTLDFLASSPTRTTMKDSYRRPWRTGLPVRGQRAAMLEWLLFQKHRILARKGRPAKVISKDIFGEKVAAAHTPMESQSVTHRDYRREGFISVLPAPTQPHDYRMEQPQTFWKEHARQVPGVSSVRTGDTPFKKCATFTTPITEYLDQPMPHDLENYPKL